MMMKMSTVPRPTASGRSPFDVSSAIAVVIVRVKPSMLPPTIITVPTSAAARPKPASSVVTSEKRASQIKVVTRRAGVTRVMTTAIALETSKGDLPLALALGMVLIALVIALNAAAWYVKDAAQRRFG